MVRNFTLIQQQKNEGIIYTYVWVSRGKRFFGKFCVRDKWLIPKWFIKK